MEEVAIDCLKLQTSLFGKWTNRKKKFAHELVVFPIYKK